MGKGVIFGYLRHFYNFCQEMACAAGMLTMDFPNAAV